MENLIKLLDNFQYELSDYVGNNKYFIVDDHIELAKYLINNNVIVQKHGHWNTIHFVTEPVELLPDKYVCSECRSILYKEFNYCPNCGAHMNGGTKCG